MMLLIVDDQRDVVNSLVRGIDWEKLMISKVFTANSAKEAKQIMEEHKISILLSDIEMPEEDGLSLFRWVKEQEKETECIFLTAHADFAYAREAIALGGFDYILQPARFEEIEKAVRKAIVKVKQRIKLDRLEQQQSFLQQQQEQLLEGVVEEIFECGRERLQEIYRNLIPMFPKHYEKGKFYPVDIQILHWRTDKDEWNEQLIKYVFRNVIQELFQDLPYEFVISNIGESNYPVVFYTDREQFHQEELNTRLIQLADFFQAKMEFSIAIYLDGSAKQDDFEIVCGVKEAMNNNIMQKTGVFLGKDVVQSEEDIRELSLELWSRQIDQGEEILVKNEIERFMKRKDREGRLSLLLMKSIHHNFTKAYYAVMEKRKLSANELFNETYRYEDYMNAFRSFDSMRKAIDCCFEYLHACEENTENVDAVETIKRYISENISKNITRKEVASHVYLNEEYCSRLFKSKTGYAFKDYLMMEKMNYAKKLLVATNFSVGIIASKIGFDNYSYFSKAFRKMEDMSPQEYRQLHKK